MRTASSIRVIFVSACVVLAAAFASAQSENKREAKISWKPISAIKRYELELSSSPLMDPILVKKESKTHSVNLRLEVGNYFFRIRGFDQENRPGVWSPVQGFRVYSRAPELIEPKADEQFAKPLSVIDFKWAKTHEKDRYQIEIKDKQGTVLSHGADDTSFEWSPAEAGEYQWRVGIETINGFEWGSYSRFKIEPSALPRSKDSRSNGFGFKPLAFRSNFIRALQTKSQGNSTSLQLSYNPELKFGAYTSLLGNFALTQLKRDTGSKFLMSEFSLLSAVSVRRFFFEFGGGFQNWKEYGSYPVLQLNTGLRFLGRVDKVWLGYERVFISKDPVNMLKLGLGFDFGFSGQRRVR